MHDLGGQNILLLYWLRALPVTEQPAVTADASAANLGTGYC
jgi:hypothetical protein